MAKTKRQAKGAASPVEHSAGFAPAEDPERRHRTSLFVVAFTVEDARRRARVRRVLASFGFEVAPSAFEVPTSVAGVRALERAIAPELLPGDTVRIYPICARCRSEARLWGEGDLAGLTPAIVF